MFPAPLDDGPQVQHTRELERILRLPRRTWTDDEALVFADQVSVRLRKPGGRMSLRPIQAISLYELATFGGLFAAIAVGGGKTLISALAALVVQARRPLILTRANLVDKTWRELRELAYHWPIPNHIQVKSYDILGRAAHSELLKRYEPDLIVADEGHRLKNPDAACTKRVTRYIADRPLTRFVLMTGSVARKSIREYAHLLAWTLKPLHAPIPATWSEREDWAGALDETKDGEQTVGPGALYFFCTPAERQMGIQGVRTAYRRRLVETPGVVSSSGEALGASLTIEAVETDMLPATDEAFKKLRTTWQTPDDWPISDPMRVTAHLRELAMGFFYRWDPRPPQPWLDARKGWAGICRHILTTNRRDLDSEKQVVNAVDAGLYPEASPLLAAWRNIAPTFKPNTVPVWLDDSVINLAATWAMKGPGIVWCEHVAFAERLASKTKLAYYGEGGKRPDGAFIEAHPADQSLIASVGSNSEGRNLQKWSRGLIVSCPPNAVVLEQTMGREHRPGQDADEVVFNVVVTCHEHVNAFERAQREARKIEDSTPSGAQKLNYADIIMPTLDEIAFRSGARWQVERKGQ